MTRILKGTFVLVHLVSCRPPIGDQTETQIGDYPTKPREVKLLTANKRIHHVFAHVFDSKYVEKVCMKRYV